MDGRVGLMPVDGEKWNFIENIVSPRPRQIDPLQLLTRTRQRYQAVDGIKIGRRVRKYDGCTQNNDALRDYRFEAEDIRPFGVQTKSLYTLNLSSTKPEKSKTLYVLRPTNTNTIIKKQRTQRSATAKHEQAIHMAKKLSRKLQRKSLAKYATSKEGKRLSSSRAKLRSRKDQLSTYRKQINAANSQLQTRRVRHLRELESTNARPSSARLKATAFNDHPIFRTLKSPETVQVKLHGRWNYSSAAEEIEKVQSNLKTIRVRPKSADPHRRRAKSEEVDDGLASHRSEDQTPAAHTVVPAKKIQRPKSASMARNNRSNVSLYWGNAGARKTGEDKANQAPTYIISGSSKANGKKWTELHAALERRGWVEHSDDAFGREPTLLWTIRDEENNCRKDLLSKNKNILYNHFHGNHHMTTKSGLSKSLNGLPWIKSSDPGAFAPATYDIGDKAGRESIEQEFLFGAALCLLRSFASKISLGVRMACMYVCWNNAQTLCGIHRLEDDCDGSSYEENSDIADMFPAIAKFVSFTARAMSAVYTLNTWTARSADNLVRNGIFEHYDEAVNNLDSRVSTATRLFMNSIADGAREVCVGAQIESNFLTWYVQQFAQLRLCQEFNTWIVKPANSSCAVGVRLTRNLQSMLQDGREMGSRVAQRYIERPFLVHGRKFDLRVWVLVTSLDPLVVYYYNSPYLRLCSMEYTDLRHASSLSNRRAHLCNASLQNSTKNAGVATSVDGAKEKRCQGKEPGNTKDGSAWEWEHYDGEGNVWSKDQFIEYLGNQTVAHGSSKTGSELWEERVIPGLKRIIIDTLEACSRQMKPAEHRFELYGFDVLLDDRLKPWLLEVNLSPRFSGRTPFLKALVDSMVDGMLSLTVDKLVAPSTSRGTVSPALPHKGWCGVWEAIRSPAEDGMCDVQSDEGAVKTFIPSSHTGEIGVQGMPLKWKREKRLERIWIASCSAILLQRAVRKWLRRRK